MTFHFVPKATLAACVGGSFIHKHIENWTWREILNFEGASLLKDAAECIKDNSYKAIFLENKSTVKDDIASDIDTSKEDTAIQKIKLMSKQIRGKETI